VTHQGHYIDFQMTLEHRGNFLISLDILGELSAKAKLFLGYPQPWLIGLHYIRKSGSRLCKIRVF